MVWMVRVAEITGRVGTGVSISGSYGHWGVSWLALPLPRIIAESKIKIGIEKEREMRLLFSPE